MTSTRGTAPVSELAAIPKTSKTISFSGAISCVIFWRLCAKSWERRRRRLSHATPAVSPSAAPKRRGSVEQRYIFLTAAVPQERLATATLTASSVGRLRRHHSACDQFSIPHMSGFHNWVNAASSLPGQVPFLRPSSSKATRSTVRVLGVKQRERERSSSSERQSDLTQEK